MKNKFSPASDTLAVMTLRPASEPVAKLTISQDCILLTLIVSIVRGILTPYRESHISLKASQTVYFVQAPEREGYSYIVFLYSDGSSLCSCKEGCQRKACPHTDAARAYEAQLAEEEARQTSSKKANLLERKELGNGTTLYIFQSSRSSYKYYITTDKDGTPDPATHQDCEGYHYKGQCCHMAAVLSRLPVAAWKPIYAPRTQDDANWQAAGFSPRDDAYYAAKFKRMDEQNAIRNRQAARLAAKKQAS